MALRRAFFGAKRLARTAWTFTNTENIWASRILAKHRNEDKKPALTCDESVAGRFAKISREYAQKGLSLEDAPREFCDELMETVPGATDDQLINVLESLGDWAPTAGSTSPRFRAIWNRLDWQCHERYPRWSADQLLRVGYLWDTLRLGRINLYNGKMVDSLMRDIAALRYRQFIQLLFHVNVRRSVDRDSMRVVEKKLIEFGELVTAEDMAIAAMAFFKTKTRATEPLLVILAVKRLEESLEAGDDLTVSALAKFLKISARQNMEKTYHTMQEKCVAFLSRFNQTTLVHLALASTPMTFCNGDLLETAAKFFPEDLGGVRLKDMARMVFCLVMYAPHSEHCRSFCERTAKELCGPQRETELERYSEHMVGLSLYLAYIDEYRPHLLNMVLNNPGFIKKLEAREGYKYHREIYALWHSVRIDRPDWHIDPLPAGFEHKLQKTGGQTYVRDSLHDKVTDELMRSLNAIAGRQFCRKQRLLPHFPMPDIIFETERGRPVECGGSASSSEEVERYAVVYGNRGFYTWDTKEPLGINVMRLRHLKRAGWRILEVPGFEFLRLRKEQKEPYLRGLLTRGGVFAPES